MRAEGLVKFLNESPVSYIAGANVIRRLEEAGFCRLSPGQKPFPGERCYKVFNDTTVIAFSVPEGPVTGMMIAASHLDSPGIRLRVNPELSGDYIRLSGERYGGAINDTWLDRPLSIAGRVVIRTRQGIRKVLVDLNENCAVIPNVAIHLQRNLNEGHKVDQRSDLYALFAGGKSEGGAGEGSFARAIAEAVSISEEKKVEPEDILSHDLFLYNNQPACVWGENDEFFSGPRLDDLACVYASLEAFTAAEAKGGVMPVLAVFDNEEIGSETKQGAGAVTLSQVLREICENTGANFEAVMENTLMLSADNAHARHPNHPEISDVKEYPLLNKGVVVKHSPRYATCGVAEGLFACICERAGVPLQSYANRPDLPGGATLGNIADTKLPVNTVDIGIAQLAMHSAYETMGAKDIDYMIEAMRAVYESEIVTSEDQIIVR
ncbi:MAG: M18 family aminopeptidase [Clostridiales bacterium]|nr:M18 family aminopeptidase [Clostridiales bacterium]